MYLKKSNILVNLKDIFKDNRYNFCDEFSTSTAQNVTSCIEPKNYLKLFQDFSVDFDNGSNDDDDDDDIIVGEKEKDNDDNEMDDDSEKDKETGKQEFLIDSIILKQENSIYFQYIILYIHFF